MCVYINTTCHTAIKSNYQGAVWADGWLRNQELQALGIPCQPDPVSLTLGTSGSSGDKSWSVCGSGLGSRGSTAGNGHGCVAQVRQALRRGDEGESLSLGGSSGQEAGEPLLKIT